jgi:hypothetical protein
MKQATMKIQKGDVPVILLSALGGFLLVFFSLAGKNLGTAVFVGLVFGVPSGAGGGTLACIFFRRYLAKK